MTSSTLRLQEIEKARKIARNQLRGVFGGAALVAGAQGLPFFGVVAMISNMFKEDDEEDFETSVRKYYGRRAIRWCSQLSVWCGCSQQDGSV